MWNLFAASNMIPSCENAFDDRVKIILLLSASCCCKKLLFSSTPNQILVRLRFELIFLFDNFLLFLFLLWSKWLKILHKKIKWKPKRLFFHSYHVIPFSYLVTSLTAYKSCHLFLVLNQKIDFPFTFLQVNNVAIQWK